MRDRLKLASRRLFELGQRAGVDILPRHFYSQIPDIAQLRREHAWRAPHSMTGVRGADLDQQLDFMRSCCTPELAERLRQQDVYGAACRVNEAIGYGPIEAQFLYCFMASRRPRRVVQVGAGVSTAVMLGAADDAGFPLDVTCIEPYPSSFLRRAASTAKIHLIEATAQDAGSGIYGPLCAGDLLFVDSTHTVKPGSEVNQLVLDVIPSLAEGVFVHFHDILFPYDHSPRLLHEDFFFWSESVLVHALLVHNDHLRLRVALSMLHHQAPAELGQLLSHYQPALLTDGLDPAPRRSGHFPSAAYLETTAGGHSR